MSDVGKQQIAVTMSLDEWSKLMYHLAEIEQMGSRHWHKEHLEWCRSWRQQIASGIMADAVGYGGTAADLHGIQMAHDIRERVREWDG